MTGQLNSILNGRRLNSILNGRRFNSVLVILVDMTLLLPRPFALLLPHLLILIPHDHPRVHDLHRLQQYRPPIVIDRDPVQRIQQLHAPHEPREARIRLLVQVVVRLSPRSVIGRIVDLVDVKVRPPRPPRESHGVLGVGIILVILLVRHLVETGLFEVAQKLVEVGVVLTVLGMTMRSGLEDVHGVDDEGAAVPKLVMYLLQKEVGGDGHQGEGGHLQREDSAHAGMGAGRGIIGDLGVFDFELHPVRTQSEPFLRLPPTLPPHLFHEQVDLIPQLILPSLHVVLVILNILHPFQFPMLVQHMTRTAGDDDARNTPLSSILALGAGTRLVVVERLELILIFPSLVRLLRHRDAHRVDLIGVVPQLVVFQFRPLVPQSLQLALDPLPRGAFAPGRGLQVGHFFAQLLQFAGGYGGRLCCCILCLPRGRRGLLRGEDLVVVHLLVVARMEAIVQHHAVRPPLDHRHLVLDPMCGLAISEGQPSHDQR
mmetsp:Transcript_29578/g.71467  ORF Transcript_29578/g.71467 Transcript_29578/m.71467 type:complete len:486 (+) Transcript_29578:222-1679(+)